MTHAQTRRYTLSISLLLLAITAEADAPKSTKAPISLNLPDLSNQFTVGYEPTHTNYAILRENLMAIAKKAFLGTGKGVLTIETPANRKVRESYLEQVKKRCPECRISEVRESHGTISYQITFPDQTYIRSSLDAGALEWQTFPETLPEQIAHGSRHQLFMFDLPREAGTKPVLHSLSKMLGGHVTESGYGGDTFWYAASLKLDAEFPEFSRGFFGKDDYNANPVKRWALDQQQMYAAVLREHDEKWEKYLRTLESALDSPRTLTTEALMRIHASRDLMSQKELGDRLLRIYHNPKQESKFLGKRSKPKYVAQKPGNGTIESRSINPQKNAREMELLGRYRLRRFEYIRKKLDQGLDVEFIPELFEDLSANDTAAQARVTLEELGLDWNDYAHFGPEKNPTPTGKEKRLADFFRPKKRGALQRDHLHDRVLDFFHSKDHWTDREWRFVLTLIEEHGTTAVVLEAETRRILRRLGSLALNSIPVEELEARVALLSRIVNKFRVPSRNLYQLSEPVLQPAFLKLWSSGRTTELASWLKHLSRETLEDWGKFAQAALKRLPDSRLLDLQSRIIHQLELLGGPTASLTRSWFHALSQTPTAKLTELPELLMQMDERLGDAEPALRQMAYSNLASAEVKFPPQVMRESDAPTVLKLARLYPENEGKVLRPFRLFLTGELERLGYGLHDHYRSVVLMDQLLAATPVFEKEGVIRELLVKAEQTHALKNDPDTASILEMLNDELRALGPGKCAYTLGGGFYQRLQSFLLGGGR